MDKKMKIIALIALLAYVISPVDLAPGPVDDMIMCLMYAIMNYKTISNELKKRIPRHVCRGIRFHIAFKRFWQYPLLSRLCEPEYPSLPF